MKSIVILKENTQTEINRIFKEAKITGKEVTSIFVCTTKDEIKNNGYIDLVESIDMDVFNVIIIK